MSAEIPAEQLELASEEALKRSESRNTSHTPQKKTLGLREAVWAATLACLGGGMAVSGYYGHKVYEQATQDARDLKDWATGIDLNPFEAVPQEPKLEITEGAYKSINESFTGSIPEKVEKTEVIPLIPEEGGYAHWFIEDVLGYENGIHPYLTKSIETDIDYNVRLGFANKSDKDVKLTNENGMQVVTITYNAPLSIFIPEQVNINSMKTIDSNVDQILEWVPGDFDVNKVSDAERTKAINLSQTAAVSQARKNTKGVERARAEMIERKENEITKTLRIANPEVSNFEVRVEFADQN